MDCNCNSLTDLSESDEESHFVSYDSDNDIDHYDDIEIVYDSDSSVSSTEICLDPDENLRNILVHCEVDECVIEAVLENEFLQDFPIDEDYDDYSFSDDCTDNEI